MPFPRYVETDLPVMVTRGTMNQTFFFAADPTVNDMFGYLLGLMQQHFELAIHSAVLMSDHWHLVVTDRQANLPAAIQWLNSMSARAVNKHRDRKGTVYCPIDGVEYTYPRCEASVLDRIVYAKTNPVRHGAVRHAHEYPGFVTRPEWYTSPPTFKRPSGIFPGEMAMPESVTLVLSVPDSYAHLDDDQFRILLEAEVAANQTSLRRSRTVDGKGFMGPRKCSQLDWQTRARTPHERGQRPKEVIARDSSLAQSFQATLRAFRKAYAEARARWLEGDRLVEWPQGTWKMCRIHHLPMAGPEAPPTT